MFKTYFNSTALAVLTSLAAVAAPAAALAEAAPASASASAAPPGLDEVLVLARRHAESSQKVPMSISVLDQTALAERSIRTANDLTAATPGLSGTNVDGPRSSTSFSIRGQGQARGQVAPGVVGYFAEVPDFGASFFDMQSIQVLKGPQGTLFRRNTSGGAILFVPETPTNVFGGHVTARVGTMNRLDADFAISGALIKDKLLVRVAGQALTRDGFTRSIVTGAKLDDEDKRSLRATVIFRPVEGLENTTIYARERIRENGTGVILANLRPTSTNARYYDVLRASYEAQRARGPRTNAAPGPNIDDFDSDGVINTTKYKLSDTFSLKNIASYRKFVVPESNREQDGTELEVLRNSTRAVFRNKSVTEELQLQGQRGPLNGVVGYYYELNDRPLSGQNSFSTQGVFNVFRPFRAGRDESKSVYAQGDFAVTPALTLTAGVRRTEEEKKSFNQVAVSTVGGAPLPFNPVPPISPTQVANFKATTWTLAANYKVAENLNLYATARRGFKGGGFNGQTVDPRASSFEPEYVVDFEAGAKGRFEVGGWRFRGAVDVFYDKYKDIQRSVTTTTIPVQSLITNAARAHMYGFDLDLNVAPTSFFSVSVAYTNFHGKYDSYIDPTQGDLSQSRFPYSPEHQWTITPTVTLPVNPDIGVVKLFANIYHQSRTATEPANVPNGNAAVALIALSSALPSYTTADVRLDWSRIYGSSVSAAVYVRNVTDETYPIATGGSFASSSGTSTQVYNVPRLSGVELRYDF